MKIPSHKPKQLEFIEQRKKADCGIACAAMLCDRLYGDVIAISQALGIKHKKGICLDEMFEIFEEFDRDYNEIFELPTKGRALLAVQWKEQDLSGHYIVWDSKRKQFLDPLYGIISKREMLKLIHIDSIWRITKRR